MGRASFLLTLEAFLFFCDEFGLLDDAMRGRFEPSTRFVLTQFIEIGGDHLALHATSVTTTGRSHHNLAFGVVANSDS